MFEPWESRLLERARTAVLGTIAANGEPHLVPVCFTLVAGSIVIAIDEKPKGPAARLARLRNIARDPRVTLLVDRYDDADWPTLAWVRVHGRADVIERGSLWPEALDALRARYAQYREMSLETCPLVRITPVRVAGWRWTEEERT